MLRGEDVILMPQIPPTMTNASFLRGAFQNIEAGFLRV
jgi:hypothetical protein